MRQVPRLLLKYMHKHKTSSVYDCFIIWPSSVTLTFNFSEQILQMALLLHKENNCAILFWKPCINGQIMDWTSSIYDRFIKIDLLVWPWPSTYLSNVSNGTATPEGEQMCHIILKSMHKCRSYGSDKLNLWPFYHLTFKCDLDLQSTRTNVSNDTSSPQAE